MCMFYIILGLSEIILKSRFYAEHVLLNFINIQLSRLGLSNMAAAGTITPFEHCFGALLKINYYCHF